MQDLKLIAMDAEDLAILSAHLQDAVLRVGDLAYLKAERRFAFIANRFDWAAAGAGLKLGTAPEFTRRRTGVRFEHVLGAQLSKLDLSKPDDCLELLAICAKQSHDDDPAGEIVLHFAGGAGIRLMVECVEAELKDLGAAWSTAMKPSHGPGTQGAEAEAAGAGCPGKTGPGKKPG